MLHAWVVGGAAPAQSVGETTLPFLVSTHGCRLQTCSDGGAMVAEQSDEETTVPVPSAHWTSRVWIPPPQAAEHAE